MVARVPFVAMSGCGDLIRRIGAPSFRGFDAELFLITQWN